MKNNSFDSNDKIEGDIQKGLRDLITVIVRAYLTEKSNSFFAVAISLDSETLIPGENYDD